MRAVRELSDALNCKLDTETLKILVELCDLGVAPDALAKAVLDLREARAKAEAATEKKKDKNKAFLLN